MNIHIQIKTFAALGNWIKDEFIQNHDLLQQAYLHNRWFTVSNIQQSLYAIANQFLQEEKLKSWLNAYDIKEQNTPKRVGIIMAGNLPLVGFHDLLCVLLSGNIAVIKLSSKDKLLLPAITSKLIAIEREFQHKIIYADLLKNIDAVIATGGNNAARYFDYYFGKYPHIIRKNRNSIAVLSGNETPEELLQLGEDVFQYFGLGCRNVSHIIVPENYVVTTILKAWEGHYNYLMDENVYKNNYDYNRTILLMNKTQHFASDFVMMQSSQQLPSPISVLHYSTYENMERVHLFIQQHQHDIQCVVSHLPIENAIPFGTTQQPELGQYADNVDTMRFLVGL